MCHYNTPSASRSFLLPYYFSYDFPLFETELVSLDGFFPSEFFPSFSSLELSCWISINLYDVEYRLIGFQYLLNKLFTARMVATIEITPTETNIEQPIKSHACWIVILRFQKMVLGSGIEPLFLPWKGNVLTDRRPEHWLRVLESNQPIRLMRPSSDHYSNPLQLVEILGIEPSVP